MNTTSDAIREFATALDEGDYRGARAAFGRTEQADSEVGRASSALLTSLAGDHAGAARQIAACRGAELIELIIQGERQRAARWTDATAARSLPTTEVLPYLGVYAMMAVALLPDGWRAVEVPDAERIPRVGGSVQFTDGDRMAFGSIVDSDDGIGAMLETYTPDGLLYIPFASLRSLRFLPPRNFIDRLFYRAEIEFADGARTAAAMPLLYALSTTSKDPATRAGRTTTWRYAGSARRALGQRDFVFDRRKMIGMQRIAAIEFTGPTGHWAPAAPEPEAAPVNEFAGVLARPWWKFW